MSSLPSVPFTSDCWQKARPVKPVSPNAKVGSWLWIIRQSMSLYTGFSVKVCLFILYHLCAFVTCCCPSKLISTEHKSLSLSGFLCLSSALLLQFEYLMSALPLVTMHYFSALLRAHWLLSLPLTLPGLRPKTDTVSHTAVSHPCSLLHQFLFFVLPPIRY